MKNELPFIRPIQPVAMPNTTAMTMNVKARAGPR
jgi:hypothetical protein